jgi:hypothetical protein
MMGLLLHQRERIQHRFGGSLARRFDLIGRLDWQFEPDEE